MKRILVLLMCVLFYSQLFAWAKTDNPDISPKLLNQRWDAHWIVPPEQDLYKYGVYHFRKEITLDAVPGKYIIHVSADNRYILYVNGVKASFGPARGDLPHWRYETLDIAPLLKKGDNVLAAVVWNFGEMHPVAQMTYQTAFIVQGNTMAESAVNTDDSWLVIKNKAYSPAGRERGEPGQYFVVGPGEVIDGSLYPWGWQNNDFDASNWDKSGELRNGEPAGIMDGGLKWQLVPRIIPMPEEKEQRLKTIRKTEGIKADTGFLSGTRDLVIPANTKGVILLDQEFLTIGYPTLVTSGGKESSITLVYCEALFDKNNQKGNRDEIEGRLVLGEHDVYMPDGGNKRLFRPLWYRTYRYIQMELQTGNEPLTINDFYNIFTAYPFNENASFECNDKSIKDIWDISWRTARLCAVETYYDCPFYEQLQYVGDTRIQTFISLYVSGDDRLMKNAIQQFYESIIPEGLTASRHPSDMRQIIPTYSLFWIAMIHDYWMLRQDEAFIKQYFTGIAGVLAWYDKYIDETGILGPMPWWSFVDWPDEWAWNTDKGIGGVPDGAYDGHSSIIAMQYVYTLELAADLFENYGETAMADKYEQQAVSIKKAVHELCYDSARKLYADTPEKKVFSQHANVMAVLTHTAPVAEQKELMNRVLTEKDLIQCTFYFRFYLVRAMVQVGLGDLYVEQLQPWRDMLANGLTTCSERPDPTRSDCHAWSASPNYDLLATVCGILPDKPGFASVLVEPHLGSLEFINGVMPHPAGMIKVVLKQTGKSGISGSVSLPGNIPGRFVWKGQEMTLKPGENQIKID